MSKRKVSATVSPDLLKQAQELIGSDNVSEVIDQALGALLERELERRWIQGYGAGRVDDLPGEVPVDLADVPWDDDAEG